MTAMLSWEEAQQREKLRGSMQDPTVKLEAVKTAEP